MFENPILRPFLSNWFGFAALLGFLIVFKILASPSFKGWFGEIMVIQGALRKLDPTLYQQFHDLYLPRTDGQGGTQIDHVVVSPFGIYVIETKNYRGWIFGTEKQKQWTQQIYRRKHHFQNPLHQNHLHVLSLMAFLGLPEDHFLPAVFFIGNSEFKTEMPGNVLNHGLLKWIKSHTVPRLDSTTLQQANLRLDHLNRSTNRKAAARNHVKELKARCVG